MKNTVHECWSKKEKEKRQTLKRNQLFKHILIQSHSHSGQENKNPVHPNRPSPLNPVSLCIFFYFLQKP